MLLIVSFYSEASYDFKPVSYLSDFKECVRAICEDLIIKDDAALEGTEHFVIELNGLLVSSIVFAAESDTATITIFEDDVDGMLSDSEYS